MILNAAASVFNNALKYDPATQNSLKRFSGKTLLWRQLPEDEDGILIQIDEQQPFLTLVKADKGTSCSVSIFGSINALIAMMLDQSRSPQQAGLRLEGDLRLLSELKTLIENLDIDWEAALASKLGDASAHVIAQQLRRQYKTAQDITQTLPDHIHDFLTEELRTCPNASELQAYYDEVDILQSDYARLEARVNKLQALDSTPNNTTNQ